MPVDQTGETILFEVRDGHVEAQIQIEYEGEAEQFAWIVPVMALPEVGVGSDALLQALLERTAPTFDLDGATITCARRPPAGGAGGRGGGDDAMGCGGSGGARNLAGSGDGGWTGGGDGWADDDDSEGGDDEGEPPALDPVVARGLAGAFEYAVLEGGDVEEITTWLEANDYLWDPEAAPILQSYIDEGFLFVALRLEASAEIGEIHPVTLRYAGDEPCIPIRLTRIAARENMGVRAIFLGDQRVVPSNYQHVTLNPWWMPWFGGDVTGRYEELVTLAVDEAGGLAFTTEFAGSADPGVGVPQISLDVAQLGEADAPAAVDMLQAAELLRCDELGCTWGHPLVEGIVSAHLPAPEGIEAADFYACVACYEALIAGFDPLAFAADIDERVVAPARHAQALLDRNPYWTRLFTTLSPHEMVLDPLFVENPDMPDELGLWFATETYPCLGPNWLTIGEVELSMPAPTTLPDLDLPFAQRIERCLPAGPPIIELDNQPEIDDAIATYNEQTPHTRDDGSERFPRSLLDEDGAGPDEHACAVSPRGSAFSLGMLMLIFGFTRPLRRRAGGAALRRPT